MVCHMVLGWGFDRPLTLYLVLNKVSLLGQTLWLSCAMLLKDLPEDARPREKLLTRGAAALSDAELLALMLRSGIRGKNVLQLAQELVDTFGGVAGLLHTPAEALKSIKGLGACQARGAGGRVGAVAAGADAATGRKANVCLATSRPRLPSVAVGQPTA
jgi:hypothetical protein